MRLSTSLVAVKRITSTVPRSTFSDEELEQSAKLILEAEGIINPIVLRPTSLDSYEVVEGDFEYYAAARAKEISPRKGEMIGAFILEEDKEEAILKQIKLLRKSKSEIANRDSVVDSGDFGSRLTNHESYIRKQMQNFQKQLEEQQKYLEERLKEFEEKIPNLKKPLDVFNEAQLTELAQMLVYGGLTEKNAAKIAQSVGKERKSTRFNTLSDVVERVKIIHGKRKQKAISSDTMIKIVNNWSNIFVK